MTAEDNYAAEVAQDYARFVHIRPFYEYFFAQPLRGFGRDCLHDRAIDRGVLNPFPGVVMDTGIVNEDVEAAVPARYFSSGFRDAVCIGDIQD
jgi:hypothetical protein